MSDIGLRSVSGRVFVTRDRDHGNGSGNEPDHDQVPSVRRRVLIAEDDPAVRTTVTQILSGEGYVVIEAEDGEAAIGILMGSPIDVLVLDLAMPRLDGMDLLRKIDPSPPAVIVHAAFAHRTPEQVQEEGGSKLFRILKKPTSPATLVSAVADAIATLDCEPV